MTQITAAMVKELRDRTGAGMMDSKKALIEANGDIELAIDNMRKSGQTKAAKKASRITAEGVVLTRVADDKKYGILLEVNSETDFVAKDNSFLVFSNEVADIALKDKEHDIAALQAKFNDTRTALIAKIGENITIRRIAELTGERVGSYQHGGRIGVLVAGCGDDETMKHVAMHIAASRPEYVNPEDVPADVVAHEHQIQMDIAMQSGKPREIAEKMVAGRMHKFTGEVSLTGQPFVMNPSTTVGQMLKEKGATITDFIRFEVGEGIEKVEVDFAAEVAAISKNV